MLQPSCKKSFKGFLDFAYLYNLYFVFRGVDALKIVPGYYNGVHAELGGFRDALFDAAHGANLAGEADFAGETGGARNGHVDVGGKYGADGGEIHGRVGYFQAARYVEEYVFLNEFEANTLFEHCQKHIHAP